MSKISTFSTARTEILVLIMARKRTLYLLWHTVSPQSVYLPRAIQSQKLNASAVTQLNASAVTQLSELTNSSCFSGHLYRRGSRTLAIFRISRGDGCQEKDWILARTRNSRRYPTGYVTLKARCKSTLLSHPLKNPQLDRAPPPSPPGYPHSPSSPFPHHLLTGTVSGVPPPYTHPLPFHHI